MLFLSQLKQKDKKKYVNLSECMWIVLLFMENTNNFELLKLDWKSVFSHLWGWVSSQTDFN